MAWRKKGGHVLSVLVLLLVAVQFSGISSMALSRSDGSGGGDVLKADENLPVLGSYAKLRELVAQMQANNAGNMRFMAKKEAQTQGAVQDQRAAAAPEAGGSWDFSTTNVQVQGVDEADTVKTDGTHIYQVSGGRVVISRAYPADKMAVTATLDLAAEDLTPQELYVDEKYLVVIGATGNTAPVPMPKRKGPAIYPPRPLDSTVKAVLYDVRNKAAIKKLRELELEGTYVSSRKVGPALYLVANRNVDFRILKEEVEKPTPSYRDTAQQEEFIALGYDEIRYFPDCPQPNYLLIAGLNLDKPQEKAAVAAYLGAGETIYASTENLYVALTSYEETPAAVEQETSPKAGAIVQEKVAVRPPDYITNTLVYKFALQNGRVAFEAKGQVPGTVLNQFSLDEHQGYFRIATTTGDLWRTDERTAKNNLYILDTDLKVVGRLEGIAPGERIYSVRFLGNRGYMVTFRKVDPLFVIDLKDPQKPQILGALKIPGYSDYLHPYDENHILGFGKDTVEVERKDAQGRPADTMAFYQGLKIALFDVSDVSHPVEKFKEIIGDRGTDSELLRNHKALLFSKEKNLLAFPVTVMEIKNKKAVAPGEFPPHGEFTFQGAYVYNLSLETGFSLKGRITHLNADEYLKAGREWYASNRNVERILYIGDNLYTISRGLIKANKISDLAEVGSLAIQ
ncbi:MAG: inhibitor of cysteine peptidase [Bacillota bacterium]|nr:inhibitor of cysteine peptidase [Bacillota bacterium]